MNDMKQTTEKLGLDALSALVLKHGSHAAREKGVCAMEAVAWLAGEPHSDRPMCTCPVIASMVRRLNDRMNDDAMRTEILRPLLPKLLGTRTTSRDVMVKRGYIAADFAVREAAAAGMDAAAKRRHPKLEGWGDKLRALPPIVDKKTAQDAEKLSREARYAADAAADAAAAYAAYAAYAAAYAAAAAAAADAADAADAAYAAGRRPLYEAAARCIERMCEVIE